MNTTQLTHIEPSFAALSRSKKAIALSHNVIQLVKSGLVKVEHGTFISYAKDANCLDQAPVSNPDGFTKLIDSELYVSACAAYCIAAAMKMDNVSVSYVLGAGSLYLIPKICDEMGAFTRQNFALIESAFEMSPNYYLNSYKHQEEMAKRMRRAGAARKFGEKWCDAKVYLERSNERLVAICLNVIKNEGEFDPSKNIPSVKEVKTILVKD